MSFADLMKNRVKIRKARSYDQLPLAVVVLLGAISFLVVGYLGFIFANTIPDLINGTNQLGFTPKAIALWTVEGILAIGFWYFGCIATRCNSIVYDRWFK